MVSLASDLKSLTEEVTQESAYASINQNSESQIVLDETASNIKSDFGGSIEKLSHKIRISQQSLKKYLEFVRKLA